MADKQPFRLNLLEYESRCSGKGVGEALVHRFQNIHDVLERNPRPTDAEQREPERLLNIIPELLDPKAT